MVLSAAWLRDVNGEDLLPREHLLPVLYAEDNGVVTRALENPANITGLRLNTDTSANDNCFHLIPVRGNHFGRRYKRKNENESNQTEVIHVR